MRQRIVHGAVVDVATPAEVVAILTAAQGEKQEGKTYHSEKGVVNLDATGAGQGKVSLPRRFGWIMERVTVTANPAAAATVQLFENNIAGTDMREVMQLGAAGLYSDGFANKLYLPAGTQLFIVVVAGTANGQLLFNFQCELVEEGKTPPSMARSQAR